MRAIDEIPDNLHDNTNDPQCIHCLDSGIRMQHGHPVLCQCPIGQTEKAKIKFRELIERQRIEKMRQKNAETRIEPSLVVKYKCDKCHDSGFVTLDVPVGDPKYGRAEPCICRAEARKKAQEEIYLKLCRIPDNRPEWTLENFKVRPGAEEMIKIAWNIANDKGLKWVTYISASGYGKTHLAVGICRKWLARGKSARYVYVPDLIMELKEGFDAEGLNSYTAKMNFFKNVSLLALDDLGTENATPWVRTQLDTIIDHRYVHKLPLVVTTNKSLNELMPRIASRLQRIEIDGIGKTVVPSGVPYLDYLKKQGGK